MHVFTYGSLMFPEVWRIVVGRTFQRIDASVAGYSVFRVKCACHPGMRIAKPDCVVNGVLYLDVDDAAIARLDCFEGEFYDRAGMTVECGDGIRRAASAYVVPERNCSGLTAEAWSADLFVANGGLAKFLERYQGFSWLAAGD